jgi:protease secretion system outer membrane protein
MRKTFLASAAFIGMAAASSAWSLDLVRAYQAALQNDAQFQAALRERDAGLQYQEIGRSNLLPVLQWSYSDSQNKLTRTQDILGKSVTDSPDYRSQSNVLSLRQPLVNFEGLARYRQGVAQTSQSLATFDVQANALAVRLMEAYANVLFTQEQVALTQAELNSLREVMKANEAMWKKGESTRTDVLETRSRYLVSEAQFLEAQASLDFAQRQLEGIAGNEVRAEFEKMQGPGKVFALRPLLPATIEEWQQLAQDNNPDIRALRHAMEAARQDMERSRAGHLPRLDLVASVSRSLSETVNTINQRLNNQSTGVQLTLPLYSGGSVSATSQQTQSNYEKSQALLNAKINEVMVDLRKQFNQIRTGATRIEALKEAVDSAENLVIAVRKSITGGQRVNADLLNAMQQLHTVKKDQAQARLSYLQAWLRIKAHTGLVDEQDMEQIAAYFR